MQKISNLSFRIRNHNRWFFFIALGILSTLAVITRPSALLTFGFIVVSGSFISARTQRI